MMMMMMIPSFKCHKVLVHYSTNWGHIKKNATEAKPTFVDRCLRSLGLRRVRVLSSNDSRDLLSPADPSTGVISQKHIGKFTVYWQLPR